jgi:NADP-reducing hydrogenase subunit HndC
MLEILNQICDGKGKEGDIEKLITLSNTIQDTALCGLGQTAPNPVLSTIRHFRDEYEKHIHAKKCPAGVCKELFEYVINEEKCMGCGKCQRNCPQDAIEGEKKVVHKISSEKCIKCGICVTVCSFDAVMKV